MVFFETKFAGPCLNFNLLPYKRKEYIPKVMNKIYTGINVNSMFFSLPQCCGTQPSAGISPTQLNTLITTQNYKTKDAFSSTLLAIWAGLMLVVDITLITWGGRVSWRGIAFKARVRMTT